MITINIRLSHLVAALFVVAFGLAFSVTAGVPHTKGSQRFVDSVDAGVLNVEGPGRLAGPVYGQSFTNVAQINSGVFFTTGSASTYITALGTPLITFSGAGSINAAYPYTTSTSSGTNAFAATVNGARTDFGAGANDYASSDGTTVTFAGPIAVTGKTALTSNSATCTLNGGSPSTCTTSVTASAKCTCGPVGTTAAIAAGGCAVNLSGTTLTATSANGLTNDVNIFCDR